MATLIYAIVSGVLDVGYEAAYHTGETGRAQ